MTSIEILASDRIPRPLANYNQAMRVGDLIFLAGQFASDFTTGVPAQCRIPSEYPYYGSAMELQTRYILNNIKTLLEDIGSDMDHVVKAQVFIMDCELFADFDRVWKEFFPTPPPRTTVEIGPLGLLCPGTLVEIDVIAVPADGPVQPENVAGASVPKPRANYTPAVKYGDWVFLAGQLASDFSDQGIPDEARTDPAFPYYGSDIERQTDYTLSNLAALLAEAGSDLEHVVKAQVFLKDLNDFHGFDEVWRRYFGDTPPPRTTIQVSELLIGESLVEIDLIAVTKDGSIVPERVSTPDAPRPLANYVQAVKAGGLVFLAGQLASDFTNGVAPEARVDPAFPYYGSAIEKQADYTLENCAKVLKAAGSSLGRTVKAQVFLTSLHDFNGLDKIWRRHFDPFPPRTTVELAGAGLLVPGTLVEIDLIAAE
ncbi:MAG: RidA family protein [Actinomycetota bacterium]|nr:RidA family protein [Actinomycetota bacterium]